MGQSGTPELGWGRTAFCRPIPLFLNLPYQKTSETRTDKIVLSPLSPAVFRCLPLSSAVFCHFLLFSAVTWRLQVSPASYHHLLPSPISPCKNIFHIVRLVLLPNNAYSRNLRTSTDGSLSSNSSFYKVVRQLGMKDSDGLIFAVPSCSRL